MNHHSPSLTSDVSGKELHGLRFRVMLKPGGEQASMAKLRSFRGVLIRDFTIKKWSFLTKSTPQLLYFEWSPPWHLFVIVSDISSGNIDGMIFWHSILAFYLAFYLTFYSDILFWHSIWHLFWHPIWHPLWHLYWHVLWHSIWYFVCHMFWHTFWHAIWHSMWHSILAFYLASILTFFSGILSGILCGWCLAGTLWPGAPVEVWRGTLWSGACGGGTLWSGACGGGPAGNTAI